MTVLIATRDTIYVLDPATGEVREASGVRDRRPTSLAADPHTPGRVWCGTEDNGVICSDDRGLTWRGSGLEGEHVMAIAASPSRRGRIWAGTEPSMVYRSDDGGGSWGRLDRLLDLPSSSEWSFPPRPDTHHVRWIACHPADPDRLWVAVEAGALIRTDDAGEKWHDRVEGGPFDTHELELHPADPERLRVAAGDGYYESRDGGGSWNSPMDGLDIGYLRSVAIHPSNPELVLVSGASGPRSTYVAGRSDGRVYRREGAGPWARVGDGWPDPPDTIAPLLVADPASGGFLAADERGVHRSDDGRRWERIAGYPDAVAWLRGISVLPA